MGVSLHLSQRQIQSLIYSSWFNAHTRLNGWIFLSSAVRPGCLHLLHPWRNPHWHEPQFIFPFPPFTLYPAFPFFSQLLSIFRPLCLLHVSPNSILFSLNHTKFQSFPPAIRHFISPEISTLSSSPVISPSLHTHKMEEQVECWNLA